MGKTLVCRCEDVTLHELEDAIARGHDDLESLKRYTGFGTGWCQGKSCVALCARLLTERGAAELPITPRPRTTRYPCGSSPPGRSRRGRRRASGLRVSSPHRPRRPPGRAARWPRGA